MNICTLVNQFIKHRIANARYASFDYCFNYFRSFEGNRKLLAAPDNLHMSCLQVGFFLASWGMFRKSALLDMSVRHYETLVAYFASAECALWNVHPRDYLNEKTEERLTSGFNKISQLLLPDGGRDDVAVTKVMLGVCGCFPALDDFFRTGMPHLLEKKEDCKFSQFGPKAIRCLGRFYRNHEDELEKLSGENKTLTGDPRFPGGCPYPAAKIIDMVGFQHGRNIHPKRKKGSAALS